jgi:hypothetical protein
MEARMTSKLVVSVTITAAMLAIVGCDVGPKNRPAIALQACAVDALSNTSGDPPTTALGTKVTAQGWAADTLGRRVGEDVFVYLVSTEGKIVSAGKRSTVVMRPDVAKHFGLPGIEAAGLHAELSTNGLSPGTYQLMIESRFADVTVACNPNKTLTLK